MTAIHLQYLIRRLSLVTYDTIPLKETMIKSVGANFVRPKSLNLYVFPRANAVRPYGFSNESAFPCG